MSKWRVGLWGLSSTGTLTLGNGEEVITLPLKISGIVQRFQHSIAKDVSGNRIMPQDSPCRSWGFIFHGEIG